MGGKNGTPIERLMWRVVVTPGPLDTPCWTTDYMQKDGYARMNMSSRVPRSCHLVAYEHFVGPVPSGLVLDHLCRVRHCCNPAHLEPVTDRKNFLRGEHRSAITYRTNICQRGHSMEVSAYIRPDGRRACRACMTELQRAGARATRRAAA